jgi:hypothetical protein
MSQTTEIDKNIINLSVYQIKFSSGDYAENVYLYAYTALWCGPCKRIKPTLIEIMKKNNYKLIEEKEIEKSTFKKEVNDFIPFFVVMKDGEIPCCDGCDVFVWGPVKVDSIQTSDETLLTKFLSKNKIGPMVLDDNF